MMARKSWPFLRRQVSEDVIEQLLRSGKLLQIANVLYDCDPKTLLFVTLPSDG